MRIVTYIMIFFIAVALLVNCRTSKPALPESTKPMQDTAAKPQIQIESLTIDKPVFITIPGKDTTSKLEITVTTPKNIVVPVFDTVSMNKWVETYFHDLKETFYSNEGLNANDRAMLVLRIRSLLNERDALKDSITALKLKYAKAEKTVEATEDVLIDIPKYAGLGMLALVLICWMIRYIYRRRLENMRGSQI